MLREPPGHYLTLNVIYDRYIGGDRTLEQIVRILRAEAAPWSERLRIALAGKSDSEQLDELSAEKAGEAILRRCAESGPAYKELAESEGRDWRADPVLGDAEIRGSSPGLVVVVEVDAVPRRRIQGRTMLLNSVSFQIRKKTASLAGSRSRSHKWAAHLLKVLAVSTAPAWGAVSRDRDWYEKVMDHREGHAAALTSFGDTLPGLFWLNFFGDRAAQTIGKERLLTAPDSETSDLDHGVLLRLEADFDAGGETFYGDVERAVIEHLGREHFFDRGRGTSGRSA